VFVGFIALDNGFPYEKTSVANILQYLWCAIKFMGHWSDGSGLIIPYGQMGYHMLMIFGVHEANTRMLFAFVLNDYFG